MINGLVTVVLPIYNVEKYLNRSIESVINQTYNNIEILLIDDGSPDNCPAICDTWAMKDNRVKVIHKENQGLGMARNTGIENANGEYICFFDSDDYIALDTVEKLYSLASKDCSDIVIFGFNNVDSQGNVSEGFVPKTGYKTYEGEEVLDEFFPDFIAPDPTGKKEKQFYMSAWLLLYSMKSIKSANWKFTSERVVISEDVYSLLSLFKYVNKVSVLPEALYFYRQNNSSLSRVYRSDRYDKIKHFYCESVKLCREMNYSDEIIHRVSKPYISFTVGALKQICFSNISYKEKINSLKHIVNDNVLLDVLKANKNDKNSFSRNILFFAIKNKLYMILFLLFKIKD